MTKKLLYEAPECKLRHVRIQNSILTSSNYHNTTAEDADPEDVDEW